MCFLFILFIFSSVLFEKNPSLSSLFISPSLSSPSSPEVLSAPALSSHSSEMTLVVDYNKRAVPRYLKKDVLKALIHLKSFAKFDKKANDPISSILVIDKSGSMDAEGKMAFAVEGARSMIDLLTENDTVGVVVYDTYAKNLFDVDYATEENKAKIHSILSTITPSGMTKMYDGLKMGIDMLLSPSQSSNLRDNRFRKKRLILLSDGLPQEKNGLNSLVTEAHKEGITISSIGLGVDYDEQLMQEIAERGGGGYYYVRESQHLPGVFVAELGYGRRTVTRNTQAFFAYDTRVVERVEIVGYASSPAKKEDVERVQRLLREKRKERRALEEKREQEEKKAGTIGGDAISENGTEVVAVDIRDFLDSEEREMLVYLTYSTAGLCYGDLSIDTKSEGGRGGDGKGDTPCRLKLGTLAITYMQEDPASSSSSTTPTSPISISACYTMSGVSMVQLDVLVDDDGPRVAAANGAAAAVEGQRRVGLAVEYDEANRVHMEAMNLLENHRLEDARQLVRRHGEKLQERERYYGQLESESLTDNDKAYARIGERRAGRQKRRFEGTDALLESAEKEAGGAGPDLQRRMKKASQYHWYLTTQSDGADGTEEIGF